jgi:hypothetical protein
MPAPKGNNYWEFRNKHGRDFKYTPEEFWQEALNYFDWISAKVWNKKEAIKSGDLAGTLIDIPTQTPMSIQGFCLFADIDRGTWDNYESNEDPYKDFFNITTRIKGVIQSNQFEGATVGAYNPNIIARTLGLSENVNNININKNIPVLSNDPLEDESDNGTS